MTPQLRQAIKLLQSTNLEVTAFVEEELERNPLLERDERHAARGRTRAPGRYRAAASRRRRQPCRGDVGRAAGRARPARGGLVDMATTAATATRALGGRPGRFRRGRCRASTTSRRSGRTLREHLAEQVRLTFGDPRERLIAAQIIALVEPPGGCRCRMPSSPPRMGCAVELVARVRGADAALRPAGLFCARPAGMPGGAAGRAEPAGPGDAGAAGQPRPAGAARHGGADGASAAWMPRTSRRWWPRSGGWTPSPGPASTRTPAPRVVPDVLMRRAAGRRLAAGAEPGDDAARAGQPRLPRAAPGRRAEQGGQGLPGGEAAEPRTGW